MHRINLSKGRQALLLAVFGYIATVLFYTRKIIGSCSTAVLGWPGDNLGLTWLFKADSASPWWSFSSITNFPNGEPLWQPVYILGQLLYIPYWILAKLFGPYCGYTLLISIGLVSSATIMYLFVSWLLKNKYPIVAFFAGFALMSFPYLQIKITNHFSYAFPGIIVLLLWLLLLWKKTSKRLYLLLSGLLIGLMFYFDPYFILLTGVVFGCFVAAEIINHAKQLKEFILSKQFWLLVVVPLVAIVIALPMIYVRLVYSAKIDSLVSNSRGPIIDDAVAFSARPWEYMLPTVQNPLSPDRLKNVQKAHYHGSNLAENPLYVGWTIIILAFGTIWLAFKRKISNNLLRVSVNPLVFFLVTIVVIAGIFSLPPRIHIRGIPIYLPSILLISLTNIWRVLARLVIDVQIGLIILASIACAKILTSKISLNYKRVFTLAIFVGISLEFLTFLPAYSFKTAPSIYQDIKNDKSIRAIAEYPLVDPPQDVYGTLYAAYQQIHMKPMLNTYLPNSETKRFRQGIMNLYAEQTVGVLCAKGVSAVTVHDHSPPRYIPFTIGRGDGVDAVTKDRAWLYSLDCLAAPKLNFALVPMDGFDGPSKVDYKEVEYFMHEIGTIDIVKLSDANNVDGKKTAKIELYTFEKQPRSIVIKQGDTVVWSGQSIGDMNKQTITFEVDPVKPITIYPENPPKDFSLVVSNMIIEH